MSRTADQIRNDARQLIKLIANGQASEKDTLEVLCAYIEDLANDVEELKAEVRSLRP